MPRLALACTVLVALAAGSAAVGLAARGADPARAAAPGAPGAFVERLLVQVVRDDYARAWLTLHPAHQAIAPRWTYVDCELLSPVPGDIVSIEIVGVTAKRVLVAGVGRLPTKAVAFRLLLRDPSLGVTVEVNHTSHVVAVGGHWRWILTPERYELYRSGACAGKAPSV